MLGTLENPFHGPSYLIRILRDYLKDRYLFYEISDENVDHVGSSTGIHPRPGLPECFLLPLVYRMPEESRVVGYAANVATLVIGRIVEQRTTKRFQLCAGEDRSNHFNQKEDPDPAFHVDPRIDGRIKTSG